MADKQCKCDQCKLEARFSAALVAAWVASNDEGLDATRVLRVAAKFSGGTMAIAQDADELTERQVRGLHYACLEEGYAKALEELDMPPSFIAIAAPQGRA